MRPETLTRRVGAGLSASPRAAEAAGEAAREARAALGGAPVDLAFLFVSADHFAEADEALAAVEHELDPGHVLGCVAEGVVGRDRELEDGPAAAVWAASLPEAKIETFHSIAFGTDEGVAVNGIPSLDDADLVTFLVDPFTFPAAGFLSKLNEEEDAVPLVGGLAAGGGEPDTQALFLDGEVLHEGAVGAVLRGVRVRTVVSQGCAPVGRDSVITNAEDNVVFELAGEPALERLKGDLGTLTPAQERSAARGGVLAGLVIDENRSEYRRGDYLMRGLIGIDEETGALAVGEPVRIGQTLRFHVRDAATADEDLRANLGGAVGAERAAGALLFTCNARGTSLFPEPDHDARAVSQILREDAVAGFFCAGEIGPVGGKPFLHGFTATLAVFLEN
jgi:small ligand-binding sensory domain FIST